MRMIGPELFGAELRNCRGFTSMSGITFPLPFGSIRGNEFVLGAETPERGVDAVITKVRCFVYVVGATSKGNFCGLKLPFASVNNINGFSMGTVTPLTATTGALIRMPAYVTGRWAF